MSTEIEALKAILDEEWSEMNFVGIEIDGFETIEEIEHGSGRWSTSMETITRGPSGKHYSWRWERAATELQENDRSNDEIVEVIQVEKVVVVLEWVKAPA